jgi:tetratricopeptide (TPR) repeat protein
MMHNSERYKYYNTSVKRKKRKIRTIVLLSAAAVAVLVVTGLFLFGPAFDKKSEFNFNELWDAKNYNVIISICDKNLLLNPLDAYFLIFKGFSSFYKIDSEPENKSALVDGTIVSLRKARICGPDIYDAEIDYILGISYFNKGKYYYDLAIRYCESALAKGYEKNDILKCLGIANGELGYPDKELEYFLRVLKTEQTDQIYLYTGKAYMKMNDAAKAEEYIIRALNKANDPNTEKECRFMLGEIYFQRNELFKAEEQYLEALKVDDKSANAHYRLSEIYQKMNNTVKARAELRETLILDPSHYDAKVRYYK